MTIVVFLLFSNFDIKINNLKKSLTYININIY